MKNLLSLTLCTSLIFILSFNASAQYEPSRVDKKAVELYEKGLAFSDESRYAEAIALVQKAVERDANYLDAILSLAGLYGQLKDYSQSVRWYETALAKDAAYASDFLLPYAINLAGKGDFEKALSVISQVLAKPNLHPTTKKAAEYRRKTFEFAVDHAAKYPLSNYVFAPKNAGDAINSPESEYFPSMPIDGKLLVYTRRVANRDEDFFASEKTGADWSKSVRLPGSINTPLNEGAQNISQDGEWLVFTACNREDGMGNCDIYISYKTNEGWSEAFNLGNKVNTDQWESQPCLSPDKRSLYFASRRFDGYGGSDIFVSHLLPSGQWGEPVNLGPTVNTSGDEFSPFMHADNQTLFFTSNGLPGYGNEDLFFTKRISDEKWAEPRNLGYPINTIDHEGTIFIAADGKTALYASDRSDSKGGLDIYTFELREDIRPARTFWVKGKVYDVNTAKGLPSSVELIDIETGQVLSKLQTDETGNYLVTLPVGKNYVFNVNRKGYLFYSDNFSLKNKLPDSTYKKDIALQPIEVEAGVVLKNLFFETNQYQIQPSSEAELNKLVQFLKDNPTVKIRIEGHTDNVGSAADNQKLSTARAYSVVNYLIEHGIKDDRLVPKGYGATKPVADNITEDGRAQNRRTELRIVSK